MGFWQKWFGKTKATPPIIGEEAVIAATNGSTANGQTSSQDAPFGLQQLFAFLDRNEENRGYQDALLHPDSAHLQHQMQLMQQEVHRHLQRSLAFYADFIREIDFHVLSRQRMGMVDTVDELRMKRQTAEDHIGQIHQIENDLLAGKGLGLGILTSYERGFRHGLAAISHQHIINKKL